MRKEPRKNWRGFNNMIWRLVKELIREEFPNLEKRIHKRIFYGTEKGLRKFEYLDIGLGETYPLPEKYRHKDRNKEALAFIPPDCNEDEVRICLVLHDDWLTYDEEEIKERLRHELLHCNIRKHDIDIDFILEALRRNIILNEDCLAILYAHRISEELNSDFDKEFFDMHFPEGFDFWATLVPIQNSLTKNDIIKNKFKIKEDFDEHIRTKTTQ